MIRVRTVKGKVATLKESVRFVELCDNEGKLAAVVFVNDTGLVRVISPGDVEFGKYCAAYRPEVSTVIESSDS